IERVEGICAALAEKLGKVSGQNHFLLDKQSITLVSQPVSTTTEASFVQAAHDAAAEKINNRLKDNLSFTSMAIRAYLQTNAGVLRPKQPEIIAAVADAFDLGHHAIYLDEPGGAGKTVVSSQIVRAIQKTGRMPRMLYVTRSKKNVEQVSDRF